jgi:hypothetical protein
MQPIEQFRLGYVDSEKQTAELLDLSGAKVALLEGSVLEAQFLVSDGGYLLVTSDEDPFEGCLHICLLDDKFEAIDGMRLGSSYHPGTFRDRGHGPGDTLQFSFFADEIWQLDITAGFRLTFARPLGPARYTSPFYKGHRLRLWATASLVPE